MLHAQPVTAVDEGIADLVAAVSPAIANPDLGTRWKKGAYENEIDQASVWHPGELGYSEYQFLQS